MMQYIKYKLSLCLLFAGALGAQEIESGLIKKPSEDLNTTVENIVGQAKNQDRLLEFNRLREIVSVPFDSTPLFLQTLESLKLAEERKNEVFSRFLPRVTSSVGGGVKSGGLNNDGNSQSINLNVTQLVYDFGVTGKQLNAAEKESLASQSKVEGQRTDLLLAIITTIHEVYRAETQLVLSQGFVDARKGFLESTKQREELGGASNADVIRAETKLSEALDKIPVQVKVLKDSRAKLLEFFENVDLNLELTQLPVINPEKLLITDETVQKIFIIRELDNQLNAAMLQFEAEKNSSFGRFNLQAAYQNTDTNLLSPQEQSSLLLTYQIDIFTGFERASKINQASYRVSALEFEKERQKRELETQLRESINSFDAQSALVLSRAELVVGAKLSNQVNKELFELNKTSINDLFRSQEEYISAAKNLVDAMVDKNLSFYQMLANFGLLLQMFDLGA
ncbi:TolC family protein [Betaproteobacteria bacterium]|nr:TolC family protein [Betaproteobacteria bacterium]